MSSLVAYIVVFVFAFFAGSFILVRYGHEDPTEPSNFSLLVGASLIWPITIPLTTTVLLLLCIAKLAINLSEGMK